ncbi:MAG: glycoside hydrolase [Burkholderiales bacterium PBB4]|nr:MAG: glycoside hydrolase [Burkholderiales bacterium PBB4]
MSRFSASTTWLSLLTLSACGGAGGSTAATPQPIAPVAQTATAATLAIPADHVLVWSDEFSSDGLPDATKWVHETGRNKEGWYNNEKQYYSSPRLENARVQNGILTITARKEARSDQSDWGGQAYSSTRLATLGKKDWTYGFFEIRAKLPCGKGTWPAIWMLGSQGTWPAQGELDIMEWVGSRPERMFSTVHTTSGSGGNGKGADAPVSDACNTFHNYQMHWTPQQIVFAVDGKVHFTYKNPGTGVDAWPFDAPQFMILNVAVGGDLGGAVDDTIFPVQMNVDYVRVYQKPK